MTHEQDENDHQHDSDRRKAPTGYVTERGYFERILQERRRAHDAEHDSHNEKHLAEQQAMGFARRTLEQAVLDAKASIEERHGTTTRRLDTLESGGAPFASRLDESLTRLKSDVDGLKEGAVTARALDTVRKANTDAIEAQRKQIRLIFIGAAVSFGVSLLLLGIQILT